MTESSGVPEEVSVEDVRPFVEESYGGSWVISYYGAECKFEISSREDAVLYDLEVPEKWRNQGIGAAMVRVAEQVVRRNSEASMLYAQIGASNGGTKYVLAEKCGFDVLGVDEREDLGRVVDAQKKLR